MLIRVLVGLLTVWSSATSLVAAPAASKPASKPAAKPAPTVIPPSVTVERDIKYVPDGDSSQVLDIYLPKEAPDKPLPLIVWIHGGGWKGGSKENCPTVGMVTKGYITASVEYRFSQKAHFPAQLQDCKAAIRWLRANSKKYHIDPDHIGAWGSSAGGHLVALLGTTGGSKDFAPIGGNEEQSDRVQAVCDWYGPADFSTVMAQAAEDKTPSIIKFNAGDPYSSLIGVQLGKDTAKMDAVSPVHHVTKDDAPILIMHGTADPQVPFAQSVELAEALKKAGVEVTLQKMPGAGHGGPAFAMPKVRDLITRFFDKHLKGKEAKIEPLPEDAVAIPVSPVR